MQNLVTGVDNDADADADTDTDTDADTDADAWVSSMPLTSALLR